MRQLPTNQLKIKLIKRGYDIICPECFYQWGEGTLTNQTKCRDCGHRWRVNSHGIPNITEAHNV